MMPSQSQVSQQLLQPGAAAPIMQLGAVQQGAQQGAFANPHPMQGFLGVKKMRGRFSRKKRVKKDKYSQKTGLCRILKNHKKKGRKVQVSGAAIDAMDMLTKDFMKKLIKTAAAVAAHEGVATLSDRAVLCAIRIICPTDIATFACTAITEALALLKSEHRK